MSQDTDSLIRNELVANAGTQLGCVIESALKTVELQQEEASVVVEQIDQLNRCVDSIQGAVDAVDSASQHLTTQSSSSVGEIQGANDKMRELEKAFEPIYRALEVINGIADKTKLLALNATIQAAKAGETGRSFAVVANEIRELSKVTQDTNAQIKEHLSALSGSTSALSRSMSETVESLRSMQHVTETTREKISTIVGESHNLATRMSDTHASGIKIREQMERMGRSFNEVSTIHKTFGAILNLMREQGVFTDHFDANLALFESIAATTGFHAPERFSKNEPEYVLKNDDIVISSTDTKGIITYANDTFYRIAGYEIGSLVGKPHNVIRHRDMPKAGFKHLWDTIQAGKMWQGVVVNRGAKGVIYWVKATAFPVYENHKIIGYISVRGKPTSTEISRAKEAYRRIP